MPKLLSSDCNRGKMPQNGDWVLYNIHSNKQNIELKLSIVGTEKYKDKIALWFEMIVRAGDLDYIIKRLIIGDPLNPNRTIRQIVKIINKSRLDYSPAIEIPVSDQDYTGNTLTSFPCIDKIGEIMTYKFKNQGFNAFIIKSEKPKKSQIIFSKEIPFFGIIRSESEDAKIELIDFGKGAKSEIFEEAIKLFNPLEQEDYKEK